MNQRDFLEQITVMISNMPPERIAKIHEARARLFEVVKEYGEDGQMGLALLGLEFAAAAEAEDEQDRILNAMLG
jgi:hypothetical protein